MRIIGGKYKSRTIKMPAKSYARPTTDLAREALFNILTNSMEWDKIRALDLFSGTGSVALEMVSRGCKDVVCVEQHPLHFKFICSIVEELNAKELHPVKTDVFKFIQSSIGKFDLIFADPPYDLPEISTIPDKIFNQNILNEGGIFVLEHPKDQDFSQHPRYFDHRRYGSVHFSFFR